MLVLLRGDPLACCITTSILTEKYGNAVQILILEDQLQRKRASLIMGPPPHCITSLPEETCSHTLSIAARNYSQSSVIFMSSVRRLNRHQVKLESSATRSVTVEPSPDLSSFVMYNPQSFERYLRSVLRIYNSCRFIDASTLNEMIQLRRSPLIIQLTTKSHMSLPKFTMSKVHWVGLNNWSLPTEALIFNHRSKLCVVNNNQGFEIRTAGEGYDLGSLMEMAKVAENLIREIMDNFRVHKL